MLMDKVSTYLVQLSPYAIKELEVIRDILTEILAYTQKSFHSRDIEAAKHIEPLEQVVDDMIDIMRSNHLSRLREGKCDITTGTTFLDILSNVELISDVCSNIGFATIARVLEDANEAHSYAATLHKGEDSWYNEQYEKERETYLTKLQKINI